MMIRRLVWFVLLLTSSAGCREPQLPPFDASRFDFVEWPKDAPLAAGTSACYGLFDDKLVYVVWSDMAEGWAGGCESGRDAKRKHATHKVGQASTDGRKVYFEFQMEETKSGQTGSITIAGSRHSLAAAKVFLVSTKGGGPARVTAVNCDLSSVKGSKEDFEALSKREPKIAAFLAKAGQ